MKNKTLRPEVERWKIWRNQKHITLWFCGVLGKTERAGPQSHILSRCPASLVWDLRHKFAPFRVWSAHMNLLVNGSPVKCPPKPSMTVLAFKDGPFLKSMMTHFLPCQRSGKYMFTLERTQQPEWVWEEGLRPGNNVPGSYGLCEVCLHLIILCL